jgi:DNA-binding MarR family transcriptional regulator
MYDQMLEPSGLTIAQFSLLARLLPEEGLSIGALGEALQTDPTTLTRNSKPLVAGGFLQIYSDAEDRRRRMIALTKQGRDIVPVAYPLWRKAQAELAELLGSKEIASLNKALDLSLKQLTKHR